MGGGPAPIVLQLQGITKRFGDLLANDGIDLELRRGEVLALLGENGAGKTTLMSILFGHYVADAGTVRVADADGRLATLPAGSPHAALAAGVGMVHQHFALAGQLTALENILLGTEPLWGWRQQRRQARGRIERLMAAAGLAVPLDAPAGGLSVGERQRIEILKALYRDARVLILDEPTAVLTPDEAERLFATLDRLAAEGLAILFISHKLDEVMRLSSRIAVLRAGRKVAEFPTAATTPAAIAEAMVGRAVSLPQPEPARPGRVVLDLAGVDVPMARGMAAADLTLAVRAHEIVGIAGVSGNGQRALAALIAGMAPPRGGTARLDGAPWPAASPRAVMAAGVGRVPED
ncbi:MAG: ATP-binding cassette domain-containing protein, partial [Geminicoccaceae bacterium]